MKLQLTVQDRPLTGTVTVPGDKSLAHRVALFGALAEGESVVGNYPDSGVTRAMRGALETLGVPSSLETNTFRIVGHGFRPFPNAGVTVDCGNSATTIRLLAGALAGTKSEATLDGSVGLRKRPMDRIAEPLRAMGASVETTRGCAPLRISPVPLHPIGYDLPQASAQVLSCLQLAALGTNGECRFTVPGPVRDHTARMLCAMGAEVQDDGETSFVQALGTFGPVSGRPYPMSLKPLRGVLPGDMSSAAFLFAAAAIVPGSRVTVCDVDVNPTRTGFLDLLAKMGAEVRYANPREELGEPVADVTVAARPLKGISVRGDVVVRAIDEFPAFAVVAACAEGATRVRDARELRYKETDRIAAICTQLKALGVKVSEEPDGFTVWGGTLKGGTAQAHGDHRLAMSMALLGLRAPVIVEGAEILNESFPSFVPTLQHLGVA